MLSFYIHITDLFYQTFLEQNSKYLKENIIIAPKKFDLFLYILLSVGAAIKAKIFTISFLPGGEILNLH